MFWIASLIMTLWFVLFATINYFLNHRKQGFKEKVTNFTKSDVTFLIAARNEADNISACLNSIITSCISDRKTSIVLIDDHSDDATIEIAESIAKDFPEANIKILLNNGIGKKSALLAGSQQVETELIYLMDADCELDPNSLETALSCLNNSAATVVLGMVKYIHENYFQKLIALEQLNTMAVTQAFANASKPIMANGGNLLFHAQHLDDYRAALKGDTASGDDMFFLEQVLVSGAEIYFDENSLVKTKPPSTLSELLAQRVRWAGKAGMYKSTLPKMLPLFVFGINFGFILLVLASIYTNTFFYLGLLLIILKATLEYAFHVKWFCQYGHKHRVLDAVLLSAIYPFYVSFVGIFSLVRPSYEWKGRQVKNGLL